MLYNCLLVHNNNVIFKNLVPDNLEFRLEAAEDHNLDKYITDTIIPLIKEKTFNILIIKDTLSTNYLSFYGLVLLIHIRLSSELGEKRYSPIVIVSDLDIDLICRLNPFASSLFTPNTYFSSQEDIEETIGRITHFDKLNANNFKEFFIDRIEIKTPKDYLSKHSIANEWSIYKWANLLNIISDPAINAITDNIASSLYFKYLKFQFELDNDNSCMATFNIHDNATILYIDDEWEKGWDLIFKKLFHDKNYQCIKESFKDKESEDIKQLALEYINRLNPQVVILDLRLCDDDFDNIPVNNLTGTIILEEIKKINPGIQCIMFTATGRSVFLNHLNEIGILGYIKKESPEDSLITTSDNIKNLEELVNKAINNKYLTEIYNLTKSMLDHITHIKPIVQNMTQDNIDFLEKNIEIIFNILNSDTSNKLNYTMLTIYKCLEIIKDELTEIGSDKKIYVKDNFTRRSTHSTKEEVTGFKIYTSTRNRLQICLDEKLGFPLSSQEYTQIPIIARRRNDYIHPHNTFTDVNVTEILTWTRMLKEIVIKLS